MINYATIAQKLPKPMEEASESQTRALYCSLKQKLPKQLDYLCDASQIDFQHIRAKVNDDILKFCKKNLVCLIFVDCKAYLNKRHVFANRIIAEYQKQGVNIISLRELLHG